LLGLSLLLLSVLASHYMTFAALVAAMTVDYFFWQRHPIQARRHNRFFLEGPVSTGTVLAVVHPDRGLQ
jgi:hypothetical protein